MKLGIHSIIKDCYEPYLLEWFNYHRSVGVDYFFIYDNESKIPIYKTISCLNFQSSIYLELFIGKASEGVQRLSYIKFLADIKKGKLPYCDRVAFIDEDEFIICESGNIKNTLEEYSEFSGIGISWRMFGSSGILKQSSIPQMEKFTHYTGPSYSANRHIKSIVNPYLVKDILDPHSFSYLKGFCVGIDKNPIKGPFSTPIYKKLWINHYWTRSLEEWTIKQARGRVDTGQKLQFEEFEYLNNACTEEIA